MELLESVGPRPRQARYQAALRPDRKNSSIGPAIGLHLHPAQRRRRATFFGDLERRLPAAGAALAVGLNRKIRSLEIRAFFLICIRSVSTTSGTSSVSM